MIQDELHVRRGIGKFNRVGELIACEDEIVGQAGAGEPPDVAAVQAAVRRIVRHDMQAAANPFTKAVAFWRSR
jgi:hypothetical protein